LVALHLKINLKKSILMKNIFSNLKSRKWNKNKFLLICLIQHWISLEKLTINNQNFFFFFLLKVTLFIPIIEITYQRKSRRSTKEVIKTTFLCIYLDFHFHSFMISYEYILPFILGIFFSSNILQTIFIAFLYIRISMHSYLKGNENAIWEKILIFWIK